MTMINRLFRSFDPIGSLIGSNYLILGIVLSAPIGFTLIKLNSRRSYIYIKNVVGPIREELRANVNRTNKKGKINVITSLFVFILIINLIGLTPYVFTISAQIIFTIRIALPMWAGFFLFSM
jgi:F0F1-type ATP synthase membrane subunit a